MLLIQTGTITYIRVRKTYISMCYYTSLSIMLCSVKIGNFIIFISFLATRFTYKLSKKVTLVQFTFTELTGKRTDTPSVRAKAPWGRETR